MKYSYKYKYISFLDVLIISIVGLLAFSNSFNTPFFFDDVTNIIWNPAITDISNFFASDKGYASNPRRFIGVLSFALNYHFNGSDVFGYHAVNFAIHLANAFLMYALVATIFRPPFFKLSSSPENPVMDARFIALFCSLLFIAHPLATQSVTYIVQRYTSLATLFFLLSLVSYSCGRTTNRPSARITWLVLSALNALLAMKTKEIAFTLPLVVILYERMFFTRIGRAKWAFLFSGFLLLLIVPISLLNLDRPLGDLVAEIDAKTRVDTDLSRWSYLMTQMKVIATYLRLIVLPINQNLDYDYAIYHSLFTPAVLASTLLHAAIILAAAKMLFRSNKERQDILRLAAFGIFWFYITLSVESGIIPIVDVIFEHRTYLPSVGAFLAISSLWFAMTEKVPALGGKTRFVVPALVIMLLTFATYERNKVWQSEVVMWEDVASKSPAKPRVHNNLGTAYQMAGDQEKAVLQYKAVLELDPDNAEAYNNLGIAYRNMGDEQSALDHYQTALELMPDNAMTHNNIASMHESRGEFEKAIEHYRRAVALKPAFVLGHSNLGNLYLKMGMHTDARLSFAQAIELKPDFVKAVFGMGMTLMAQGDEAGAIKYLKESILINPGYSEAHNNLGVIYASRGEYEAARNHFNIAVTSDQNNVDAWRNLKAVNSILSGTR